MATVSPAAAPLLDVHDVAELCRCSERHVYRQVELGRMPAPAKLGFLNRWPRVVIEQWIADGCPTPRKAKADA
jgi:predicted DNA-binding transcriptional regulator AlpA